MGLRDTLFSTLGAALSAGSDAFAKAVAPEQEPIAEEEEGALAPSGQKIPDTSLQLQEAANDPKSLFWDPFAVIDALGFKDKPGGASYATLSSMVWRMPIVHSIIITRLNQVANFATPVEDQFATGFRIRLRDRKADPTPETEATANELEQWLMSTGKTENPQGRDNFETFLRKFARDSLTYDQACMEVVPDRSGKPSEFYAVDGATVRIADTTKLRYDEDDVDQVRYVQVYDGLVVAEYTQSELLFGVRNPSTDIRNQNYGHSELEMLASTITSLLWAWDYNQKFFSQGTSAKGIINFKGAVPDKQIRAFRRHWYSQVAGIENSWKTPITNADELQYINMQQSNRDMEFNAWFDFLIKITSAMYGMDPMEVNFRYGDSGGASSMFESNNANKLTASKDKGLKPILRFIERGINSHLIQPLNPEYVFEFVGLEASSPNDLVDLQTKKLKSYMTVDEIRAEEDRPPLPNGEGAIILDPTFLQNKNMAAMQDGGEDQFGEDPSGNGDEGPAEGDPQENPFAADTDTDEDPPKPNPFDKSLRKSARSIIIDLDI